MNQVIQTREEQLLRAAVQARSTKFVFALGLSQAQAMAHDADSYRYSVDALDWAVQIVRRQLFESGLCAFERSQLVRAWSLLDAHLESRLVSS